MWRSLALLAAALVTSAAALAWPVAAQDKLKVTSTGRGNWDTAPPEIMQRLGLAKKHGLDVEIYWTQTPTESQQALLSGNADIAFAVGILQTLRSFAQGLPVRIVANQSSGAHDLYWYVKADSPVRAIGDASVRSIGFSTIVPPTAAISGELTAARNSKVLPVATGAPAATLSLVVSGQVDVGWAAPPFGLDQIERNEIRIVAKGNETSFGGRTLRVAVASAQTVSARKDVVVRFVRAWRETLAAMYAEEGLKAYAEWLKIEPARAQRMRDMFYPRAALEPDGLIGLDLILEDAVRQKVSAEPLTRAQQDDLLKIPAP